MILKTLAILVLSSVASATPFKLLTTEAAVNPPASGVIGLQEAGLNLGPVFVDTNPLFDVALIENIGAKFVYSNFTVGGRYIYFAGSGTLENQVRQREPRIKSFSLNASGPMLFAGYTLQTTSVDFHFNMQYANISGSKVTSPVFAANLPIGGSWDLAGELGYDFSNDQMRASIGFLREGPSVGWRLGVTYVKIDDPYVKYAGVAPILDFYWLIGAP